MKLFHLIKRDQYKRDHNKSEMEESSDLRLTRINRARQILNHPAVINASLEKRERTIQTLLDKGLRQDDLQMLLAEKNTDDLLRMLLAEKNTDDSQMVLAEKNEVKNETAALEALPYDAFFSLVIKGNIRGRDLIRLCHSSSKLNEMCNRSRHVNGKTENQFLFRELLRRMGKQLSNQSSNSSGETLSDPRLVYIYYAINRPEILKDLIRKIREYSDLQESLSILRREVVFPTSVFHLLYFGSLSYLKVQNDDPDARSIFSQTTIAIEKRQGLDSLFLAYGLVNNTDDAKQNPELFSTALAHLQQQYKNISFDVEVSLINQNAAKHRASLAESIESVTKYHGLFRIQAFVDRINTKTSASDKNHPFLYLKDILDPYGYSLFLEKLNNLLNKWGKGADNAFSEVRAVKTSFSNMFKDYMEERGVLNFTPDEIQLIIDIHEAVLEGKLPLDAPFTFDAIFNSL